MQPRPGSRWLAVAGLACLACVAAPGGRDPGPDVAVDTPAPDPGPAVPAAIFVEAGVALDVRIDGEPWTSADGWLSATGCGNFLHGGRRVAAGDFRATLRLRASPPDGARVVLQGGNRLVLRDTGGNLALEGPWFAGDLETLGPSPVADGVPFTVEVERVGATVRLRLDGVLLREVAWDRPGFGTVGVVPGLAIAFLGQCFSTTRLSVAEFRVDGETAPLPPAPPATALFVPGDAGYAAFRIPAVVRTTGGALLAFAEGRKDDVGDSGDIDTVLRRSLDGGGSWTPLQVVCDLGDDTCGNPVPIVDRQTGVVSMILSSNDGTVSLPQINAGKATRELWVTRSDDDGATWTPLSSISADVKGPDWRWVADGPGHGIQLASGRLVAAGNFTRDATASSGFAFVMVSDDHGATWRRGGEVPGGFGDESTVVERADGSLLLGFRSRWVPNRRGFSVSTDGGETWSAGAADPALIEPHCEGSLLGLPGRGAILFSNPASAERELLSVRTSLDGGATWPGFAWLYPGPSAYSDLADLGDGTVAIVYERGRLSPYESIVFQVLGADWLSGG